MKVVMVEPNKPAYVTDIGDDYKALHNAVGGLIEPIYYLDDPRAVMVGNEEAKVIGLEGNRRFDEGIVAGTFVICGNGRDDFCSLPDDLCEKYVLQFAVPESIEQSEVQQDMGMTFICF